MKTDFLVIGGGIAGLSYAIKVAEHLPEKNVVIVTKEEFNNSNTQYAQGGIASVLLQDKDDFEKHIQDTLIAGDFKNDREIVELVVKQGHSTIKKLIQWGVEFDKNESGEFEKCMEGGHSQSRILHHKDITGREIQQKLILQTQRLSNIIMLNYHLALDIIVKDNTCKGIYTYDKKNKKHFSILSKITLMASGGVGQVYKETTNPLIATGDGIAMANRVKAKLENLDLIQFHPTALYQVGQKSSFLISEAVRGFGAILRNTRKEAFMEKYHYKKELAPRDIVSRAIFNEMKITESPNVFLDIKHLNIQKFKEKFPNIVSVCRTLNLDLSKDCIPVVPMSHYLCGGIQTDIHGETSIHNLYACGECASTGLHGSNRLASNSLLEAVVFAHQVYLSSLPRINYIKEEQDFYPSSIGIIADKNTDDKVSMLKVQLQELMSKELAVEKSNKGLQNAQVQISKISKKLDDIKIQTIQSIELRNLLETAILITRDALNRKENTGVYYNIDLI